MTDLCATCGGSGEVHRRGYSVNPFCGIPVPDHQCDESMECVDCGGSGAVDPSPAGSVGRQAPNPNINRKDVS